LKRFLLQAICAVLFSLECAAQFCGNTNTRNDATLVQRGIAYTQWDQSRASTITYVKLKVHIGSIPGPGGDAANPQDFQNALDIANQACLPGGIQFVVCGPVQIVEDNALYYFSSSFALNPYHEYGYLNVTVVRGQTYIPNAGGLAFPDHALIVSSALNSTTLAHELGHLLGLPHTHETTSGAELVNGSNCTTAGDGICDTPADPNLGLAGMMNATTCAYTGTVTDANGQPYAPLTNNVMSYGPFNCITSFTPQQFNVMHYVVDSVRTYLRKTTAPVVITPFPIRFCAYDAPVNLAAIPSGGTFTGAQVTGTTLDPQNGPPASYDVYYSPASAPDPAATYIDQYSYNTNLADTLSDIWQSFTTRETGALTAIDFYIRNLSAANFTFSIYAGTGISTTPLFTGNINVGAMAATGWVQFPIGISLNPPAGTVYTARISCANPGFVYYQNTTNPQWYYNYIYGQSVIANKDVAFREWINGLPGCQDCYRYYDVYVPPNGNIVNIASDYCIGEDTVILKGDRVNGTIYIDGNPSTLLIPSSLSVGAHQVVYITPSLICADTTIYNVNILNGQAIFQNLVDPVCVGYPSYEISTFPSGGTLTINGVPDSVFDAAALGVGTHYLHYQNTSTHDTVTFTDQDCCGAGGFGNLTPLIDTVYYQSFRANNGGYLSALNILYNTSFSTTTFETKFYKGQGTGGPLLVTDTISIPIVNMGYQYLNIFDPGPLVPIEDDSVYTFSVRRLADMNTTNLSLISYRLGTTYPGVSNLDANPAARDFTFQEIITQYTGCDVFGSDSIQVNICTAVNAATAESTISVFPNPAANEINLRVNGDSNGEIIISITDLPGQIVFMKKVNPAAGDINEKIDTSGLSDGVYFMNVEMEGRIFTVKMVVQH
jgi:hypothetical protein